MAAPLTDVRDISKLAYGFMASKALFAALNLDVFGHISNGATHEAALSERTEVPLHRMETLVAALVSTGVLVRTPDGLANAPATDIYMVPGKPAYFGDYYRFQIGGQIYGMFEHLDAGLRGETDRLYRQGMSDWLSDAKAAEDFSRAQHAGSLGPAMMLAHKMDLADARQMLDVAGGTGAYSIAFCQQTPGLQATILDFPSVIDVSKRYVTEAGMADRITLMGGDARDTEWPKDQDVVLMSYLLSAVSGADIEPLLARAHAALKPGGRLILHDFMLDDTRSGPSSAALFFLSYLNSQPDAVSFCPADLLPIVESVGFIETSTNTMIPDITMIMTAFKPAAS